MTLRCMFAQMYVTPPAGGTVVIPGAFDAGARFDGGAQPTIPVSFFIFSYFFFHFQVFCWIFVHMGCVAAIYTGSCCKDVWYISVGYLCTQTVSWPYTQAAVVKRCSTFLLDICSHRLCRSHIYIDTGSSCKDVLSISVGYLFTQAVSQPYIYIDTGSSCKDVLYISVGYLFTQAVSQPYIYRHRQLL